MPSLGVGGVSQLVDLEVALALEGLLGQGEQDDAVDDGLLHAKAADLIRAVGDVGGEEAHRLRVLNDARELKGLLARDLRVLHLVQKD